MRLPCLPPEERFWPKVTFTDSCWLWNGARTDREYGLFRLVRPKRMIGAHRFAYEQFNGPIPSELTIDHLCRVRYCVNPAHLEVVTRGENVLRGTGLSAVNARKTHCKRGHAFDEVNTAYSPTGARICRACNRATYHRLRLRTLAALLERLEGE